LKGLLDVHIVFRAGLEVGDVVELSHLVNFFLAHLHLGLQIALVAEEIDALTRDLVGFDGCFDIRSRLYEAGLISNIENANAAVSSRIIGRGQGIEFFLSCSVPDLQLRLFGCGVDGN